MSVYMFRNLKILQTFLHYNQIPYQNFRTIQHFLKKKLILEMTTSMPVTTEESGVKTTPDADLSTKQQQVSTTQVGQLTTKIPETKRTVVFESLR